MASEPNIIEMIERLTRIETKLDNLKEVAKMTAENTKDITEIKQQNKNQQKEIDEIKDNHKWLTRAVIGAIITSIIGIIFILIKTGAGM